MNAMPYDVVVEIFNYLTQQDCLECMAVCRDWYSEIPEFTQSIWKDIRLDMHDLSANQQRRQRCLGSHVKRVVIHPVQDDQEMPLIKLMQRLVDWKCTAIESLDLIRCTTVDQPMFIGMLRQIGYSLTHLKLEDDPSISVSLLSILDVCPQLTHLTCIYTKKWKSDSDEVDALRIDVPFHPQYTKITHLCLTLDKAVEKQLKRILERCPELKWLFISLAYQLLVNRPNPIIIDLLFSLCPKIVFLVNNFSYYYHHERIKRLDTNVSKRTGLYHLDVSADNRLDQITRCLTRNRETLEHVSISRRLYSLNWSTSFQSLWLPNLRVLELNCIDYSIASLVAMINRCHVLETLDLSYVNESFTGLSGIHALRTMDHLVNLRLDNVSIDGNCMPALLGRFPALKTLTLEDIHISHRLPPHSEWLAQLYALEISRISWTDIGYDISERKAVIAQFLTFLTWHSNLEVAYIGYFLPDGLFGLEAMKTIAKIPMLRELDIQYDPKLSDDELVEFVRTLGKSSIEILKIQDINDELSINVLHALATLSQLQTLYVDWSGITDERTYVTKDGLQELLSMSPNLVDVGLSNIIVKAGDKPLKVYEVISLIQEQKPRYNANHAITGHWVVETSEGNFMVIERMVIKRIDS